MQPGMKVFFDFKLANKWTSFEFFKKTLLPFIAKESSDLSRIIGVFLGPGIFFREILMYFIDPDVDLPTLTSQLQKAVLQIHQRK